jgi:hypothetical protein
MSVFFDIAYIIFLVSLFCISHSLLASEKAKSLFKKYFGSAISFYRLFYNIFSAALLSVLYEAAPQPPIIIYDLPVPFDLAVYFFQIISLVGIVYSFSSTNFKEFLGINQIYRWYTNTRDDNETDEISVLRSDGLYKYVRHPGYAFTILFFGLRPQMDVFYFTVFLSFSCYFYIGTFYEERKLVKRFGRSYLEYQERVPRLFPVKFFGKKYA